MLSWIPRCQPTQTVCRQHADGRYIDISENFLIKIGHTREEVIGHTVHEIGLWKNPLDRERAVDALRKNGRLQGFVAELCKKSGESMVCEIWGIMTTVEGCEAVEAPLRQLNQ